MPKKLPRPILVFWLAKLRALVGKMALLIIVVTSGPAHVFIFPRRWLVAATLILSRDLGRVDSSSRGGAIRPRAVEGTIGMIPIAPIFLVILARALGLDGLRAMRKHSSYLLRVERKRALVPGVIFSRFQGRAVAPGAASIHLTGSQRKVQSGFSLSRNSLLDDLVLGVFSTTLLLSLSTDRGP